MKTLHAISALVTVCSVATVYAGEPGLQRRQSKFGGGGFGLFGPGGKVAPPADAGPVRIEMEQRHPSVPDSKTIKLRYGPYKVPNTSKKTFTGESGMLWNYPDWRVEKPCDDCMIIGLNAGLEYPDGTNANIDSGMWLHHMVSFAVGPGRSDPTCSRNLISLPHTLIGATAKGSERFFASGNERTKVFFPDWNVTDAGYPLRKADRIALIVDLMNQNNEDKVVYVTMYYDYVEGIREDWDQVRPVWFDIDQCALSEIFPPAATNAFTITASTWDSNVNGDILGLAGHLHDGGTNVVVEADGKLVCDSIASYGGSPEFVSKNLPGPTSGHSHGGTEHISGMTACTPRKGLGVPEIKNGQQWSLKAVYDFGKFKGMVRDNGSPDSVMGIAIMYVRQKRQ